MSLQQMKKRIQAAGEESNVVDLTPLSPEALGHSCSAAEKKQLQGKKSWFDIISAVASVLGAWTGVVCSF